jgi:hypothetical protein
LTASPPPQKNTPRRPGQELAFHHAGPVVPALCSGAGPPRLRALELSFSRGAADAPALARVWAAPWLAQLTRLDLAADDERFGRGGAAGTAGVVAAAVPPGGLDLPQLRELWLRGSWEPGGALAPEQAAAVAACRLPRLEALGLRNPAPGAVARLAAAPWAAGLSRLELAGGPHAGWCDAQAVAALARASSLASLALDFSCSGDLYHRVRLAPGQQTGLDGPAAAALLAAPWRAALTRLELSGQPLGGSAAGDAARAALAAAPLPALRALCLKHTGVTLGGLAELAGASWARRLVEFESKGRPLLRSPERPPTGSSWQQAFAGAALPGLRSPRSVGLRRCSGNIRPCGSAAPAPPPPARASPAPLAQVACLPPQGCSTRVRLPGSSACM